jgi:hypothetical protein
MENLMNREIFIKLMDRWVKEPSFREQMKQDIEETLRRCGLTLEEDEMVALRSLVMFN